MKMKSVMLVSFLSLAVLATTSAYAGNGRGGSSANRGATNPGRTVGTPTPKKDGTGGPGKPANPAGPQDGTSPGPGPRR
ncbi:MAG: hypothetical protein HYV96_07660 [Opitutae bacterium]|nr:hypothetical protein [Opitutae bacterium]